MYVHFLFNKKLTYWVTLIYAGPELSIVLTTAMETYLRNVIDVSNRTLAGVTLVRILIFDHNMKVGGNGYLHHFQKLRLYRDRIETRTREGILFPRSL